MVDCGAIEELKERFGREVSEHKIRDLYQEAVKRGDGKAALEYKRSLKALDRLLKVPKRCGKMTRSDRRAVGEAADIWEEEVEKYKAFIWVGGGLKREREFLQRVRGAVGKR